MQPISAGSSSIVEIMAMLQQLYHPDSSSSASSSSSTSSASTASTSTSATTQNAATATAVSNSIAGSAFLSSSSSIDSTSLMALLQSQSFDNGSTNRVTGVISDATYAKWASTSDQNGDGVISKTEFEAAVPTNVTAAQADQLFASIDTGNTGSVTAAQLRAGLQAAVAAGPTATNPTGGTNRLFEALDTNADGTVSLSEFEQDRASSVTKAQADSTFAALDLTGDGTLTASEFGQALAGAGATGTNGQPTTTAFSASQNRALEILSSLPSLDSNQQSSDTIQGSTNVLASLLGIGTSS